MAARGEELNTRLTVTDDASKVVDKVADKLGELEDTKHEAKVGADTSEAEQKISRVDNRLSDLTNDEKQVVLKVQADQAERDLKRLNRELANAEKYDDEEIVIKLAVKGTIEQDLADIRKEMEALADVDPGKGFGDKLSGSLGKLPGRFGDVGGKLGDGLGKGLLGGFAALGVGALIVQSLQDSWERAGGLRKITGQFRLSVQEAGEYGRAAGRLYADNWGESIVQLQQVVATAGKRLEDVNGASLDAITAQILAVSDTWGEDYQGVIRSITQLTQNGLAASSQEALDLIVTGFQDGGNEAGDFLDTIDEYSQHWAAMGLSGEDAFNQIIAGFQGGQRDSDKLADAVKEMRLRVVDDAEAVDDAYAELGLSADKTRLKFLAGGPAAKEAFLDVLNALDDVKDPIEQNRLAVELIGTQYEDLGPTAISQLLSIEGQLRETKGAAQELVDTVGEVSPWQDAERNAKSLFGTLGDGFANEFGPMLETASEGLSKLTGKFEDSAGGGDEVAGMLERVADRAGRVPRGLTAINDEMDAQAEAADHVKVSVSEYQAGLNDMMGVLDGAPGSIDDVNASLAEQAGQADETADAVDDITDAFERLRDEISDRSAYRDVEDAFDDVERASRDAWDASIAGTEDADRKVRDHQQSIDDLRVRVLDYTADLGNVPDKVVSDIHALIDEGKLQEAEAALADLARGRTALITAQTIIAGATQADFALDPLRSYANPITVTAPTSARVPISTSTTSTAGGITIQSGAITLNNTQATPEKVVEAIANYVRRNGPI
ncbi:MAG: phage tail tape measure protein [Ilumatobacteraceae bacterium]